MPVLDLTRPLETGMPVYPGDPEVRFAPHAGYHQHGYCVHSLALGTHAGTHLDAPAHFLPGGATVDRLPLSALAGPARVVELAAAGADFLPGERILVRSGWGARWGREEYFREFPGLPAPLAEALAAAPVALVGLETPSLHPDPEEDARLHRLLLGAGVVVVENLANLEHAPARCYLCALPLPLRGLDGSPCRVIAVWD